MTGFFLAHPDVNPLACFLSSPGARGSPEAILTDPRGRNAQTAPQARTVGPRRMSAVTAIEESAEGKPHQSRPSAAVCSPGYTQGPDSVWTRAAPAVSHRQERCWEVQGHLAKRSFLSKSPNLTTSGWSFWTTSTWVAFQEKVIKIIVKLSEDLKWLWKTTPPVNLSLCSWVKKLPRKSDYGSPFEGLWPRAQGVFVCTLQPGAQPGPQARAGARLGAPTRPEGRAPPTQPCLGPRVCSPSASTVRASWYEEARTSSEILDWTKKGAFSQRGSIILSQEERQSVKLDESKMPVEIYTETRTRKLMNNKIWGARWSCEFYFQYAFTSFANPLPYRVLEYSRNKILSHCKDG